MLFGGDLLGVLAVCGLSKLRGDAQQPRQGRGCCYWVICVSRKSAIG